MDAQIVIVSIIIFAALAYFAQTIWRKTKSFSKKNSTSCATDCGCDAKPKSKNLLTQIKR